MICRVDLFSGALIDVSSDFSIQGLIPIGHRRVYRSSSSEHGTLGHSWVHSFDTSIRRTEGGFLYRPPLGQEVALLAAEQHRASGLSLLSEGDGLVLIEANGTRRSFEPGDSAADSFRLRAIGDPYGNRLLFDYRGQHLAAVADDLGRRLEFTATREGHISEVWLHDAVARGHRLLVRYDYSTDGDLIEVADTAGTVTSYEYVGHRMVCQRDANGSPTYAHYDSEGRCVALYHDGGRKYRRVQYDALRRQTLVTDSLGYSTLYRFSDAGSLLEQVDALGNARRRAYDDKNRLLEVAGDDGRPLMVSTYDPGTRTLVECSARDGQTTTVFGPLDLAVSVVNAEGHVREFEYDHAGRLTLIRSPLGREWRYRYDARGTLASVTCPDGYVVKREPSPDWSAVVVRDDWGVLEFRRYDVFGNVLEYHTGGTRLEQLTYDDRHRLIRHQVGGTPPTQYSYDPAGNLVAVTTPLGHSTRFTYDACNDLVERTDPLGNRIRYILNSEQRLVAIENERQERATIEHDPLGRPVAYTFFDGRRHEVRYDDLGNPVEITDGLGRAIVNAFGDGRMLIRRRFHDGSEQAYSYDALGRLTVLEATDYRLSYEYDPDGRIVREQQPHATIEYEYGAAGLATLVSDTLGRRVQLEYSPRRVLQRVIDDGRPYEFSTSPNGQLFTEIRFPGGMRQELAYDTLERMVLRRVLGPAGDELARRTFAYDAVDQLTSMDDPRLGSFNYQFDPAGRLIGVRVNGTVVENYAYDPCGNLISTPAAPNIAVAAGDRVVAAGPRRYEYNDAGQLASVEDGGRITRYDYDGGGQLSRVELPDGNVCTYGHDGFGRRTLKRAVDGETRFCWEANSLRATLHDTADGGGGRVDYLFIPDTLVPLSEHRDGSTVHYSFDQIGTPTEMWDDSGRLVGTAQAEAYGTARTTTGASGTALHFQGQYVDAETGFFNTHFREYDPLLGRFTTPDPLGFAAGLNLYRYPTNPLNWIDPLGLLGPTLQLECRDTWNACEQYAAKTKVETITEQGKQDPLVRTDPCRTNQRDYYERKCATPTQPGSTHDIDHMVELQLGGMDKCCSNLWEMPRSPNRSLGSQIKNAMNALKIPVGGAVGGLSISGCTLADQCTPKPPPPDASKGCEEGGS